MSELALQLIEKEKAEKTGYLELGRCGLTPDNPQLQEVWNTLGELTHLKTLILSNFWWDYKRKIHNDSQNQNKKNLLYEIPSEIANLINLKKLVIRSNKIKKLENLPPSISQLDINRNQITKLENLPQSISQLDISYNQITRLENLPQSISQFHISSNQIAQLENLPQGVSQLYISSNQIAKLENLPQGISQLYISSNKITTLENLPQNISQLIISNNKIRKLENLPQSISKLDIDCNEIAKLENLSQNIISLNVAQNRIRKLENLPQSISELNISHNRITKLENLSQNIITLYISSNQIDELENIPPNISRFAIDYNSIKDFQPIFPFIRKGIDFWINGNPAGNPPLQIVKQGKEAIIDYIKELKKGKIPNDTLKLILIGNTTVGKTSLIKYLMHEEFNPEQNSTHGMQITSWQPEELEGININVWDFGGQEYYHATHRLFLSNNAVYILLWEAATNRTGTGEIKIFIEGLEGPQKREYDIFPYEYWLESIRYYAKDSEVFMVQNKSERKINMDEKTLQNYKLDSGKEFHLCLKKAHEYHISSEGQKRWWTEYETFKETLLETLRESVAKYDLVSYWVPILDAILAREENYLDLADFEEICQAAAGKDVEIVFYLLVIYLRDIASVILHYDNDFILQNTIFIKPNWLNQNIYNILNYKVLDNEGEFDDAHIAHVVGASQARQFVALMKQFGLIFDLPGAEGRYVAPQYLPNTLKGDKLDSLKRVVAISSLEHSFTLKFKNFVPKSVMSRFLAKYGAKAKLPLYWKYGILFILEKTAVYATYNFEQKQIRIEVQNASKRVAGLVFETLRGIINNDVGFNIALRENEDREYIDNIHKYDLKEYDHLIHLKPDMKKIFISYSKDDRKKIENELKSDLNSLEQQGKIEVWYDQDILPGEEWDTTIKEKLHDADIILLMVSRKFLATDYIRDVEIKKAVERHNRGEAVVIPIILSVCDWTGDATPFSKLNALPSKGKPISKFEDKDEAWTEVLQGIKKLLN